MTQVTLKEALDPESPWLPNWLKEIAQDHKSQWNPGSKGGWPNYQEPAPPIK